MERTIRKDCLITKTPNGKIRQIEVILSQFGNLFVIDKYIGYRGETRIKQRPVELFAALETVENKYNLTVNKYIQRGYMRVSDYLTKNPDNLTDKDLEFVLTGGTGKFPLVPMGLKDSQSCRTSVLNKKFYCTERVEGIRCIAENTDNGIKLHFENKSVDLPESSLYEELSYLFEVYSDLLLDGELYADKFFINKIKGLKNADKEDLRFKIYDVADSDNPFEERLKTLKLLEKISPDSEKLSVSIYTETGSYKEIKRFHNIAFREGYYSVIAKKPNGMYRIAGTTSDCLEVKEWKEKTFPIIDYFEEDDDIYFILQAPYNRLFNAKYAGKDNEYCLQNIDDILDKQAIVRFHDWTADNIPIKAIVKGWKETM